MKAKLLLVSAVLAALTALGCASPTPIHEIVTCREISDHWTLETDSIRKITKLNVDFKGQDRMECSGYADVEWAVDGWVTLRAERDHQGSIYYFLEWD